MLHRITSPIILLVIGVLLYASYRIRQIPAPIVLFGKIFTHNQLCIALNIAGIPILYLFGVGNIMFWVVGKAFYQHMDFFLQKWSLLLEIDWISIFPTKTFWNRFWSFVNFCLLGASTLVVALHASFYNIDAIVTEEMEAFLAESETV